MRSVRLVIRYPVQFIVEQLDKNVVAVSVPVEDGKTFSPEFERWASATLGPREAAWFIDRKVDEMLGEVVKLSGVVGGSIAGDRSNMRE